MLRMAVVALSSVLFAGASFAVGPDTDTIARDQLGARRSARTRARHSNRGCSASIG